MAVLDIHHGSRQSWVAVLLSTVCFIFILVAVSIPYWRSGDNTHVGLWETCTNVSCVSFYSSDSHQLRVYPSVDGWLQSVQVLEVVSLIFSFGVLITGIFYACVPPVSSPTTARCSSVLSLITGICCLVGTIIYSKKTKNKYDLDLSSSFGLALVSGLIHLLVWFTLVLAIRRQKKREEVG